jgi:ankyrin repeat protein
MGNKQSSLKSAVMLKMPNELMMLEELVNTDIDMKTKSEQIQKILVEIEQKIIHMNYDVLSLYSKTLEGQVDDIMKDPDGRQQITPETRLKIAMLYEKLKATEKSKTPETVKSPQKPQGIQALERAIANSPDRGPVKLRSEKVFERIMQQIPHFIDKTQEDMYIKYLLTYRDFDKSSINMYYKDTLKDKVMFIYIRKEEMGNSARFVVEDKWYAIFWDAKRNTWNYSILTFDPSIEFGRSAQSMSVLEDRKIPSEADYFKLLRFIENSVMLGQLAPYLMFKNNVYEKMLGRGMRDSSGEYIDLARDLRNSNYESYEREINKYHSEKNTDKNKVIFIDGVKRDNTPIILITFWSEEGAGGEAAGRWITFHLVSSDAINFIKQKFELNESYEPSFTSEQNLKEDRKRYRDNALKYNNIFQALASNDTEVILKLLTSDPSIVNKTGSKGNTPLIYVIKNSANMDSINIGLLFETGKIDLDLVDMDGRTALHLAVINKLPNSLIHRLVGLNINATDISGYTALDYAALDPGPDYIYVKLLLILGATPKLNSKVVGRVSENVKEIVRNIASLHFKTETTDLFNEEALQRILFELYGLDITNTVSMPIAIELFKTETTGLFTENQLQRMLFELYGLDITNIGLSIPIARKLFKNEFPELKDSPVFSLPVARSAARSSNTAAASFPIGVLKSAILKVGDAVIDGNDMRGTIVKIEITDGDIIYSVAFPAKAALGIYKEGELTKITSDKSRAAAAAAKPGGYIPQSWFHHCY